MVVAVAIGINTISVNKSSPLVVKAIGKEFYWQFIYPGKDGEFHTQDDIVSEHYLHLPIKRDIIIDITSEDYIYMFRPETIRLREVAVPGQEFSLNMHLTEAETYRLEVDPMCGFNFFHDNDFMGWMVMQPQNAFNEWYSARMDS